MKTTEEQCREHLKVLIQQSYIRFTNCGNAALFVALAVVKSINSKPFILVPDQAGWLMYKKYPQLLNFEIKEIKTQRGILDLEDLKQKAKSGAALLVMSSPGYFAEQPLREIKEICTKNNCLVINDVSGSLGIPNIIDGNDADLMIGSFGEGKLVNLGYGGFISARENVFKDAKDHPALSLAKHNIDFSALLKKLEYLPMRTAFLLRITENIKKDLKHHTLIYPKHRAVNVVVACTNDAEKEVLISYCNEHHFPYTICPRYIRVEEPALCIETKRLEEKEEENK